MQSADSLTGQLRLYASGHTEYGNSLLLEILPRLRQIAKRKLLRERYPSFTPTELIGETWLKRLHRGGWKIENRTHFFNIASRGMKFVLADAARKRLTGTRGRGVEHVPIEDAALNLSSDAPSAEQVLAISMLMEQLENVNPAVASIVHLHYVAGFELEEIASETGLTLRQVRHRWHKGKVWLAKRLLPIAASVIKSPPVRGRRAR
jgi:RNA polymerase sigma factor (TIGR02999 family)